MLIRFKVGNFRSFGKEVDFSCLATAVGGHRERIFRGSRAGLRLLTVGAIYGPNASGKSNLYRAIEFARNLVVSGVKLEGSIAVQPFRLDATMVTAPSRFSFEVLLDSDVFEYVFAVDGKQVVEESLRELRPSSERVIFSRNASNPDETKWNLEYFESLGLNADERQFVHFVAKGTPKNQLFLREAHGRNVKHFEKLWHWFRRSLVLINPQSTAGGLEYQLEEQGLKEFSTRMLRSADVGIERLGTELLALESIGLPKELKQHLENDTKEGQGLLLRSNAGHRFNVRREKGKLQVAKLVSYHKAIDSKEEVPFDISEESDGTQRMIDLLPSLHALANAGGDFVVFVDEIDRSLHSRLTRAIIESYLRCRPPNGRSQLLFTTHDATLLDQTLFRRDEVAFIEKNDRGESEITSLADFKLRSDKRLMKDYLLGRFGAVPRVHMMPLRPGSTLKVEKVEAGK